MAQQVNLAQDLFRFHKVITRGLKVGSSHGKEYLQSRSINQEELGGYATYINCLAAIIGGHHTSEDLIIFPAFRQVFPEAPFAQLAADHHKIEQQLSTLPKAIADLSGDMPELGISAIVDALEIISEIWFPHIKLEETHFSEEKVNANLTIDQQQIISEAAGKQSQENPTPPYWIIPFVLFNLEYEERMKMAANFPPTIMDEMVPKVWKEQWAPMKPFLLD